MGLFARAMRLLCLASMAAAAAPAHETAPDKGPEVVVVLSRQAPPYFRTDDGLRRALSRHAASITTLILEADGPRRDTLERADVVVGVGTEAAAWLHANAPERAEVVYCMVVDPENAGLTRGRPAHGVKADIPVDEQVAFLQSALPKVRRVGVLYRAEAKRGTDALDAFRKAAPRSWNIIEVDAGRSESISAAVTSLLAEKPDVIWTIPDAALFDMATVRTLLAESVRAGVPVFGFSIAFVRAGATLGVGIEPEPHGEQTGELVLRVWEERQRHARPLQTPMTVPPRYQKATNLGVADQLGLTIPERVRRQTCLEIGGEN